MRERRSIASLVERELAGEHAQERGLPRTVPSDDAELVAREHVDVDVREDLVAAEARGRVLEADHGSPAPYRMLDTS